jgi:hypothetical protein
MGPDLPQVYDKRQNTSPETANECNGAEINQNISKRTVCNEKQK